MRRAFFGLRPSSISLLVLLALPLLPSLSWARAGRAAADLDPDTEVARRHFQAASAAYEQGDYPTALKEFERARLVKPLPDLDYNIGRCHDRLEHYAEAIAAYQRFIDATSNVQERTEVAARIEALRARQRQLEAAPAAQPTTTATPMPALALATESPPPSSRGEGVRAYRGPLALGAAGLAVLAVGFGLYGSVGGDYSQLQQGCAPSCAPSRWSGLQERERAGVGLAIAGGALIVADVAWFTVVALSRSHATRRAPSPRPAPAGDLAVQVRP
jgi:tetratricopeptide (TPR) repeat protein